MLARLSTAPLRNELMLVVVDDDENVRCAIGRLLRACGHDVRVFDSAEAYLAERCDADCAILDIQLPGLSGFELEDHLRRERSGLAVLFITARDDSATRAAVERRRRHLLAKPFDEDGLLAAIASAIDRA